MVEYNLNCTGSEEEILVENMRKMFTDEEVRRIQRSLDTLDDDDDDGLEELDT